MCNLQKWQICTVTALHSWHVDTDQKPYGGEASDTTINKCSKICGHNKNLRPCAKILPVYECNSNNKQKVFVILDKQSNRSLIDSNIFDKLDLSSKKKKIRTPWQHAMAQRRYGLKASKLVVQSLNKNAQLTLNSVIECNKKSQCMQCNSDTIYVLQMGTGIWNV